MQSLSRTWLGCLVLTPAVLIGGCAVSQGNGSAAFSRQVRRFHAPGVDPATLPPSVAVIAAKAGKVTTAGAATDRVAPKFERDEQGRYCVHVPIAEGTSLYGTGEVAGPLLRNGRVITCWNTDAYGYTANNASLYQSHPWVLAVRKDGTAFGILADTTWRCEIDLTKDISFRGEGSPYGVYVIEGASPQEVVKGLASLVGTMPLPPKWAIGYHQCRYSYFPEARVREIAKEFRDRKIPCDVIWFDIDYMNEYRVFTFDSTRFPDPTKLNADLETQGFKSIWMIDPGIKVDPGYSVYDDGTAKDMWVRNAKGEVYQGEVWPGWCVYPDYTRADVRKWWEGLYVDFMAKGIDGVWNDMNEPAVFNVTSKTMPEDNRHAGGAWPQGGEGAVLPPGPHLQYHNVYGLLMAKGTYEGIQKTNPDVRPFVLTRAGYMGSHRYAATWTGDNSAEWDDVEDSVSMMLNLGLSGQPFSGPDIGGFNGNGTDVMYERWIGFGSLLPFARGHTGKGNINKEPWAYNARVEETARRALQLRYRLMPYYYTLFHEASQTGMPVARPLFFADPKDLALRSEDDAFLLGSDVLVVPTLTPSNDRVPVMPRGSWREVDLVGRADNVNIPRLYVRGGAIVPVGPVIEYVNQKTNEPLTLIVSLDANGQARGSMYEDAGDGYGYQAGDYLLTNYIAQGDGKRVMVSVERAMGDRAASNQPVRVMVLRDGRAPVTVDGQRGERLVVELD